MSNLEKDKEYATQHDIPFATFYDAKLDMVDKIVQLYPELNEERFIHSGIYYIVRNKFEDIVCEAAEYIHVDHDYVGVIVYMLTSPVNKTYNYDNIIKTLYAHDAVDKDILKALLSGPVPEDLITKYNLKK